jgi:hypothetical protein
MGDSVTSDDDDGKDHRFISFSCQFQTLVQLPEVVRHLRPVSAGVLTIISGNFPKIPFQKCYHFAFTPQAHLPGGLILS